MREDVSHCGGRGKIRDLNYKKRKQKQTKKGNTSEQGRRKGDLETICNTKHMQADFFFLSTSVVLISVFKLC